MGSYLRWLGRSRGQEGVLLGSYLRCLGRSRGEQGVLVGSYLRCLGRFRGFRCLVLLYAIVRFIEEIWGPRGLPRGCFRGLQRVPSSVFRTI